MDEYFLFEPQAPGRPARVVGLALRGNVYHDMPQSVLPNGRRGVRSEMLGLAAYSRDGELRWFDPAVGSDLLDLPTVVRQTKELRRQAEELEGQTEETKRRIAELEALLRVQHMAPATRPR